MSFVAVLAIVVAAEPLQPFTIERAWQIQRLGPPSISADGRLAVSAVTRFDMAENKGAADLWLFPTDGKAARRLTTHAASEGSPLVSPDGSRVAFVAQREDDKAPQLYVLPLDGGEAQRLTSLPVAVSQPMWFPDGKRLAFLARVWADLASLEQQAERAKKREESKMKAQVWDGAPVTAWDTFVDDRQLHLFTVSVAGGAPQAVTLGTGLELPRHEVLFDQPLYDIAPNGAEVAFVADSDPKPNRVNADVFTLELGQKNAKNLTAENLAPDRSPSYSPDGRWLAFTRQTIKGFYGDTNRLMLVERKGGVVRPVAVGWDRSADGLVWAADSRRLYGAIDDAGTVRIYEIPLDGKPRAVTGAASFSSLALARAKPILVALRQSFTEPPTLVRVDLQSGAAAPISHVNDELLAGTALGRYESVTYPGAKGDTVQMWVSYPPGFDPAKKHPLFLLIHGGPHNGIIDGMQFRWNAQVFNSWGYVTAWPNFHGSSGFGQAFTDSINPQQDELPYEDVVRAAEWLAQKPFIDRERMAAGGGSYGGYLTAVLLGRKHPFKVLVAHAAVYNWYTQYGADYGVEPRRFGEHWEPAQDAVYRRGSPHFGAGAFNTPTLVVHGERDYRVPKNHGFELYQTLLVRGVPTRFVYFPDENHWVLKPQNSVFWYNEVQRWLAAHLPPARAAAAGRGGG